ncbi:MAG: hypothetical protein R2709_10540 [Marmoricola sp.]
MSTPIVEGAKVMSKGQITLPRTYAKNSTSVRATGLCSSGMRTAS